MLRTIRIVLVCCCLLLQVGWGQTCSTTYQYSWASVSLTAFNANPNQECVFPSFFWLPWYATAEGSATCWEYFDCYIDDWQGTPKFTYDHASGQGGLCLAGFQFVFDKGTRSCSSCGMEAYVWEWGTVVMDVPTPGAMYSFGRTECEYCWLTATHWTY